MSAETYSALEDAIRAHVSDESATAGIVTDWYLISAVEDMTEHRTNYLHIASSSPLHTLHGLVNLAHRRLLRDDDTELDQLMATLGTVDITCACGQELHVPVTTAAPESFTGELGTLTVKLHIDHAWLAAHIATHDEAR